MLTNDPFDGLTTIRLSSDDVYWLAQRSAEISFSDSGKDVRMSMTIYRHSGVVIREKLIKPVERDIPSQFYKELADLIQETRAFDGL